MSVSSPPSDRPSPLHGDLQPSNGFQTLSRAVKSLPKHDLSSMYLVFLKHHVFIGLSSSTPLAHSLQFFFQQGNFLKVNLGRNCLPLMSATLSCRELLWHSLHMTNERKKGILVTSSFLTWIREERAQEQCKETFLSVWASALASAVF